MGKPLIFQLRKLLVHYAIIIKIVVECNGSFTNVVDMKGTSIGYQCRYCLISMEGRGSVGNELGILKYEHDKSFFTACMCYNACTSALGRCQIINHAL